MEKFIFVYIPCAKEEEAEKIALLLLEKRLIACANTFPVKSFYRWKGKLEKDVECVLLVKTLDTAFDTIADVVKKEHSYELACITKFDAQPEKDFFAWVQKQVNV